MTFSHPAVKHALARLVGNAAKSRRRPRKSNETVRAAHGFHRYAKKADVAE
jgi:hypothetical protein